MSGETTPAGWYPDPEQPGQQRWWDGTAWTDARQPASFAPPTAPPAPPSGFSPPPPTGYAPPGYGPTTTQVGYGVVPAGPPPSNYMVWAIVTTILGCWPAGIVSIVKASQVNNKWNSGDAEGARQASQQAKTWAIIAAVVGVLVYIVVISANSGT